MVTVSSRTWRISARAAWPWPQASPWHRGISWGSAATAVTAEPHLHYHLQDSPTGFKGDGMPAQFLDYFADGNPVERGEPVKGQTIHN